jgi:hypothetical protein
MNAIASLIAAFGLSGAAGLNAYIPLLIVGVLGRAGFLQLSQPFDALTSWWAIGVLAVLLIVEFAVDKIPGVDHINDAIQTFVRPAAGAILFAASSGVIQGIDPNLSFALGLFTALGVHGAKVVTRPVVNASTMGVGAPVISFVEDGVAVIGSLLAIFLPVVFIVFVAVLAFVLWRVIKGVRKIKEKLA